MTTHYFIGIKAPKPIASSIIDARNKTNLHETHKVLPAIEDLHITLFYLGEVEPTLLDQIIQSLQNIDWDSFNLTTNGLGFFGNNLKPRVVYTALEDNESLQVLQQNVMDILINFIEIKSANEFHPHITIAKKWSSNNSLSTDAFLLAKQTFEVTHFAIFKINPNRTPRYEEVSSMQCRRLN